jgi:hypothetical protein
MNKFVNLKKRSIQLPHGVKNLADVLQGHRRALPVKGKCNYCGAPAVAVSICHAIPGFMDEEIERWCDRCQQDLSEFATKTENKISDELDIEDDEAMEREARQLADIHRRQKEFMRQRVRARHQ